jgi:phosphate transport system substrate-binding protein
MDNNQKIRPMKKVYLSIAVTAMAAVMMVLSSCGGRQTDPSKEATKELKGSISISGAFALYPMASKWAEEFQKLHPGVSINISAGGAGKGMADVLAGMVDMAMFSRSVKQEEIDKGAWFIAVSRDAVLPTISVKNPILADLQKKGLSKQQFTDIFITGKTKSWKQLYGSGSGKINVYNRSDACGAAEMWAKYMGGEQEDLQGVGVFGDPGIASAVKNDANGIGFNNLNYAYDVNTHKKYEGLEVIPIDINGNGVIDSTEKIYDSLDNIMKAIRDGVYPSPPARDLYFISKGKPQNEIVVAFLKWIMTEGQKYVEEAGYVKLKDEQIATESKKLE